jgi:hypothetical protein
VANPIGKKYPDFIKGLSFRFSGKKKLKNWYDAQLARVRKDHPMPALQGSVDIYSYNQSYILATANKWNPRPVFQSYAAYTTALAKMNQAHLLGESSPDNILFKIEPIDKRLPALDDGISWPDLVYNYRVDTLWGRFLLLKKKNKLNTSPIKEQLFTKTCRLGEEVTLPDSAGVVFARIDAKSNFAGKIISFFYMLEPLQIAVTLQDGTQKNYRFISGMGRAGFIISPMIERTNELGLFFAHGDSLRHKAVRSFRIFAPGNEKRLWKPEFSFQFSKVIGDK